MFSTSLKHNITSQLIGQAPQYLQAPWTWSLVSSSTLDLVLCIVPGIQKDIVPCIHKNKRFNKMNFKN